MVGYQTGHLGCHAALERRDLEPVETSACVDRRLHRIPGERPILSPAEGGIKPCPSRAAEGPAPQGCRNSLHSGLSGPRLFVDN